MDAKLSRRYVDGTTALNGAVTVVATEPGEIENAVAQQRHHAWDVISADWARIFPKDHVFDVMHPILDFSMIQWPRSHGPDLGIHWLRHISSCCISQIGDYPWGMKFCQASSALDGLRRFGNECLITWLEDGK